MQLRDDHNGLDVYEEVPPVIRMSTEAYGKVSRAITGYEEVVARFFPRGRAPAQRLRLALDLYNMSHFENAPGPRFLTLITVVEVLAARSGRSAAVRAVVDQLKAEVRNRTGLSGDERNTILNALGNITRQSIGEACRAFVEEMTSPLDAKFFAKCYQARSELVHEGKTDVPEFRRPEDLDLLVSRVLLRQVTR